MIEKLNKYDLNILKMFFEKKKINNNYVEASDINLIFTNSGEGVLFNKEYTKGLCLKNSTSALFSTSMYLLYQ